MWAALHLGTEAETLAWLLGARLSRGLLGSSAEIRARVADLRPARGAKESRTPDLCSAIAALYQLSYGPRVTG